MAANFLDLIKGEGLAVQAIKSLISSDLPGSQILSQIRNQGLGIRTDTGYQIINYLRTQGKSGLDYVLGLHPEAFPDISKLPFNTSSQLKNFSYRVAVTGTDRFSGQPRTQQIQVISDQLLSKQQAMDAAVNMGVQDSTSGNLNEPTAEVTSITQNKIGVTYSDPGPFTIAPSDNQLTDTSTSSTPAPFGYSTYSDYYQDIFG